MLRKLTNLVTNNFGLKVLGAVFAIILWLVIVNVEDPEKPIVFTAAVKIENANYLTDMGKTYEVLDGTDMISFTVTGKRSIIEELSATDFTVTANMENIDESMTKIPIVITASSYSNQLEITKKSSYVLLNVENVVTEDYKVNVVTDGELSTYCYIDSTELSSQKVSISGPESVVNRIDTAQIMVDVSGVSKDAAFTQPIVLLDEAGNEVSQERLTLSTIEVTAEVFVKMRKEIPVEFKVSGEPAAGYRYEDISSNVSSVKLEGDTDAFSSLSKLEISSSQLNISGATATYTAIIHLEDYLPEGVSLAKGEKEDAEVTVQIEAQTTTAFEIPVTNITVSGLADGLELSFNSDTVTVNIAGFANELESISEEDLYGTLDASGLQSGIYTVPVNLTGDYANNSTSAASVTITDNNVLEE